MKTSSDDLQLLLAVVDSGGFSAAAEALNIQVSRLSRAVARIESQLKITLMNRTTRHIELTEEGRLYVDQVRLALQQLQKAEEEVSQQHGAKPKGRLRVDSASPFVLHQLVPLIRDFQQEYPDIQLELTSSDSIIDLLEKRTDVAIRIGRLTDSSLHARYLGDSKLKLVAAREYLARYGTPQHPHDLARHRLLGFINAPNLNRWPLPDKPEIVPHLAASNGETLRQLAVLGHGVGCFSSFMLHEDLAAGRLVEVLPDFLIEQPEREQVHAVYYRSSALSKRVLAFIDFVERRLTL